MKKGTRWTGVMTATNRRRFLCKNTLDLWQELHLVLPNFLLGIPLVSLPGCQMD